MSAGKHGFIPSTDERVRRVRIATELNEPERWSLRWGGEKVSPPRLGRSGGTNFRPRTGGSIHAGNLHQIVGEGRRPSEAAKGVRRDRVHRAVGAVEAPPIAERGDDHAVLHVVGDAGE